MKLIELLAFMAGTVAVDRLLCLTVVMLTLWLRGRRTDLESWLGSAAENQLLGLFIAAAALSWIISTLTGYGLLCRWGFHWAVEISGVWLIVRIGGTCRRLSRGGLDSIRERMKKLQSPA